MSSSDFSVSAIWDRLSLDALGVADWYAFRDAEQIEFLHRLGSRAPFNIRLSSAGHSGVGRTLYTLRFGQGARRVLVWARQHGDELDCTAALCLVLHELITHPEVPEYALILQRLDLAVFPMVNPDGVARFTRRNAQEIDINRDAVSESTSEGAALVALKNRVNPEFCFNLHDMNPRKSANNRHLVVLAFQAGPFEPRDIDNDVRLKAKKICGLMTETARQFAPDNIARYAADYMPTAFGDSMMRWGVSSILIESGGWHEQQGGDDFVRRLFALSLLRGLHAIAAGEDQPATGDIYDAIPFENTQQFVDVILENGKVHNGLGRPPFRADMAFNRNPAPGKTGTPTLMISSIENLGDLTHSLAKQRVDCSGEIILPGIIAVSPDARFKSGLPTRAEAMPYLRAGITTIACGFGPFADDTERHGWLESVKATTPPLNIIAFEIVHSWQEVTHRLAMTGFAGFLLRGFSLTIEELIKITHHYDPASHSAVDPDRFGQVIGVSFYYLPAPSPLESRLHLHLTALGESDAAEALDREALRDFLARALSGIDQVTLSVDATDDDWSWLPVLAGLNGLSRGRIPPHGFLGEILAGMNARNQSDLLAVINRTALHGATAFRCRTLGSIGLGLRADLSVYTEKSLLSGGTQDTSGPSRLFLNGNPVLESDESADSQGDGAWFFASSPEAH